MPLTLNIIGPGRVGRALGAVLTRSGGCGVQDVLGTGLATAAAATACIGAGRALSGPGELRAADIWMITTPDAAIAGVAAALADAGVLRVGDIAFHCSGALPASVLAPLSRGGGQIASVHPLKSFAEPALAAGSFAGTWCSAEGDTAALNVLLPLFEQAGARVAKINPAGKTLYHAASVLVCNDLTALMESGLRTYEAAGLDRATAKAMMEPLVRETLDNVFALGTVRALTGPVARGDAAVVSRPLAALYALDPRIAEAYRALNAIALDLARAQGGAPEAALDAVAAVLNDADRKQQ